MKLYFLRHGLAGQSSQWRGDDFDRPLTRKGRKKMAGIAKQLAALDLKVDLILTSPLVRAYQTAEIAAEGLDIKDKLVREDRLDPGFDTVRLAEILADHRDAGALMLVGHEPTFSETISDITGGSRVVMKKGGLAYVEVPDPSRATGDLVWLIPPKVFLE